MERTDFILACEGQTETDTERGNPALTEPDHELSQWADDGGPAMTAITLPRKKHSHRCRLCREAVYCYKSQCTLPQRIDLCSWCAWRARTRGTDPEVRP